MSHMNRTEGIQCNIPVKLARIVVSPFKNLLMNYLKSRRENLQFFLCFCYKKNNTRWYSHLTETVKLSKLCDIC